MDRQPPDILPAHIEETLAAIARLHEQHRRGATAVQRAVEGATAFVGRPRFAGLVALLIGVWIALNLALTAGRLGALDPPPFNAMQAVAEIVALMISILF